MQHCQNKEPLSDSINILTAVNNNYNQCYHDDERVLQTKEEVNSQEFLTAESALNSDNSSVKNSEQDEDALELDFE